MKKLNAFQIKIILIILMLLDHIYFSFSSILPVWIHALSRCVAPMFAYFLVEGFFYTKSKLNYGIRLFSFGVFMQIGNFIINMVFANKNVYVYNNIFATLFMGFIIISIFEYMKKLSKSNKILLLILNIIFIVIGCLFTEGGISVIPFTIITYFFKQNNKKLFISYSILSLILFLMSFQLLETFKQTLDMLMFNSDFLLILTIPLILIYNGKRGLNNKFSKYFFYVFYPLHLWILAFLEFLTK